MADNFDQYDQGGRGNGAFIMGLLTGAALGAGIGMLMAPKAGSELRGPATRLRAWPRRSRRRPASR